MEPSAVLGSMAPGDARSRAPRLAIAPARRAGAVLSLLAILLATVCDARKYNTTSHRDPSKLNVHVIPHSHDDSGWLKTVDQYYWGLNTSVEPSGVQYILGGVVDELGRNPDRTFAWAESSFLARWWAQVDDSDRDAFRGLLERGQITIANGGYVQHDEACAHYESMLDQTALGHRFLLKHAAARPEVGWQLDPFGHSAAQPDLFGDQLGFRGIFFARSDYQDRTQRRDAKTLEYFWDTHRGPVASNGSRGLFAVSSATGWYNAPDGFGYEWQGTEPVADDPRMAGFNVRSRVDDFVAAALDLANVTLGHDVAFLMGTDFKYQNARLWYANLDKLVHYANLDGRVNVLYSSPLDYVKAKLETSEATSTAHAPGTMPQDGTSTGRHDAAGAAPSKPDSEPLTAKPQSFPTRRDDLFPYADFAHAYWTGYFTSRPASKGYIRRAAAELRAARQLEVAARLARIPLKRRETAAVGAEEKTSHLDATSADACPVSEALFAHPALRGAAADLRDALGASIAPSSSSSSSSASLSSASLEAAVALTQHHDAITGTAREHVVSDYHLRLAAGIHEARALGGRVLFNLAGVSGDVQAHHCEHANISTCGITVRSLLGTPRGGDVAGVTTTLGATPASTSSGALPLSSSPGSPPNPRALFALAYNPSSYARNVSIHIPLVLPSKLGRSPANAARDAPTDASAASPLRLAVTSSSNALLHADVVPVSRATRRLQASLFAVGAPHEEDIAGSSDLWVALELPALGYDAVIISLLGDEAGEGEEAQALGSSGRATTRAETHRVSGASRTSKRIVVDSTPVVETVVPPKGTDQLEGIDARPTGTGALSAALTSLFSRYAPLSLFSSSPSFPDGSPRRSHPSHNARRLASPSEKISAPREKTVTNGLVSLHYDSVTGLLVGVTPSGALRVPVNLTMGYYLSDDGNRPDGPRQPSSGAYLFRPKGYVSLVSDVPELSPVPLEIVTSPNLVEVRQEFAPYASLTTRLRAGSLAAELEWSVGPIPVATGEAGREVVLRLDSDLDSRGIFWTDSNGRELQRRQNGRRVSYDYDENEPIAANYYPITSLAVIRDEVEEVPTDQRVEGSSTVANSTEPAENSSAAANSAEEMTGPSALPRRVLSLVTDRAQGASSLAPGRLEVMLHRRILVDDERGVVEPLDETDCRERIDGKACEPRSVRGLFHFVASVRKGLERETYVDEDPRHKQKPGELGGSSGPRAASVTAALCPLLLRHLAHETMHKPLAWFTALSSPSEALGVASGSLLKHPQDPRVDLLALQVLEADEGVGPAAAHDSLRLFVRIAHAEVAGDGEAFGGHHVQNATREAAPVAVNLRHLLPFDANVARIVPVSASGNRDLSVDPELAAKASRAVGERSLTNVACEKSDPCAAKGLVVDLYPGEILAFQVDVVLADEAQTAPSRAALHRTEKLALPRQALASV